jgi:hypothetical protein
MPQVGFETTIPIFERAKTVHALDRAANLIGEYITLVHNKQTYISKSLSRCKISKNILENCIL